LTCACDPGVCIYLAVSRSSCLCPATNVIPFFLLSPPPPCLTAGGFVAAIFDLDFNAFGYVMVGVNSFFTAAYLICISKFGKQVLSALDFS
jgi:hypothetical protein